MAAGRPAVPALLPEQLVKQSGCSRHTQSPFPSSSSSLLFFAATQFRRRWIGNGKKKEKGERVTSSSFLLLLTPSSYSSHRTAVMLGAAHDRGLFVLDTLPAVAPAELESPQ